MTAQQIKDWAELANYEAGMMVAFKNKLHELGVKRNSKGLSPEDDILYNGMLEGFLLHVRNLRDFLFSSKSAYPDDLLARDFFDNPTDWDSKIPAIPPYLQSCRDKLNTQLAHLSKRRPEIVSQGRKGWNTEQLVDDIAETWNRFIDSLPDDRKSLFKRIKILPA